LFAQFYNKKQYALRKSKFFIQIIAQFYPIAELMLFTGKRMVHRTYFTILAPTKSNLCD
jgi:hypothetical protein